MITERGKTILGKYMAGQNESTFSYLAIGIGAKPAFSTNIVDIEAEAKYGDWYPNTSAAGKNWSYKRYNDTNSETIDQGFVPEYDKVGVDYDNANGIIRYSDMKELDYEVLRVPITESGIEFVSQLVDVDNGSTRSAALTDIILTGTLPSLGEYRFTEIGIYSAQSNAIASSKPSEVLFNFGNVTEAWADNNGTAIPLVQTTTAPSALGFYKSDNAYFSHNDRVKTQSRPRAGQFCLFLKDGSTVVHSASAFNFTDVRPDDQFRLAYFFNSAITTSDSSLNIIEVTFKDKDNQYVSATLKSNAEYFAETNECIPTTYKGNLYGVAFAKVSDFFGSPEFSWSNVSSISITSESRDVFLDSFKYVSTNHNNPNYGLISYSVVQNKAAFDGDTAIPDSLHKAKDLETLLQYRVRINNSLNGEDYLGVDQSA
jgi:hypothetical protein